MPSSPHSVRKKSARGPRLARLICCQGTPDCLPLGGGAEVLTVISDA